MLALSDFSCCREAATSSLLPRGTTPQRYFCNDGQTCFCVMLKGVVIVFFYVDDIVFCYRKTIRLANAEGRASDDPYRSCLLKRVSCIVSSKYFKRSFRACVFGDFEHAAFSGMFLPSWRWGVQIGSRNGTWSIFRTIKRSHFGDSWRHDLW